MKNLLLVLLVVILGSGFQSVFAQEQKMTKAEKKAEKKKLQEAQWYQVKQLIDDKQFVFRCSVLSTTNGTVTLDPKINFVIIQGDNAIVQLANGVGGSQNGIGGYTVDGLIKNYTVKAKKVGKGIIVNFVVVPRAGQGVRAQPLNLSFSVYSFDSARMQMGSSGTSFQGEINKVGEARIFKGNNPN